MPTDDTNKNFRMGTWLVRPDLNSLSDGDRVVTLEPRLMDLLTYLASRPGKIVSTDELLDAVWHGRALVDNTIYQAVAHLRKSLGDDIHDPRYIETVSKKGYRLICPVTSVAEDAEAPEMALHSPRRRRHRRKNIGIFAAITACAVAIVLFAKPQLWSGRLPWDGGPSDQSVAVLPFIDMSEDGNQQYFGDGITEELIHVLSSVPDLRVIARTSSFAFRDSNDDIRQIGRKLNVAMILEGSIRKDGDQIRVTSQLVDVRSGYHMWSQTFDRRASDILNIQNDIAIAVARTFEIRELGLLATDKQTMRPNELQAYDFYLLGLHQYRKRTPSSIMLAIKHFERAIEIDPSFARAYAGLSESYAYRYIAERNQEWLSKAEAAAEYALLLDDQSAESFAALGRVKGVKHEYSGAEAAYRKAVALKPNDVHVQMYLALHISKQGRREEALVMVKNALELDPMSGGLNHWMGQYFKSMPHGDWDTAFEYFERAMDRDPDYPWPYMAVGLHYWSAGQLDQAIPYFSKVVDLTTGPTKSGLMTGRLASTYVDIGDHISAAQVIRRARKLGPDLFDVTNSEIHLQIARRDFSAARDIVHSLLPTYIDDDTAMGMMAFYEMVIGDAGHAEEIYARLAVSQEPDTHGQANLYRENELAWGMMSAVNLAYLHKRNGDTGAARELLAKAREYIQSRGDRPGIVGGSAYVLAQIAAIEERNDTAIDYAREAVEAGWTKAWFARIDPIMDDLRKEARYTLLLDELEDKLFKMRERAELLASNSP